MKKKKRNNKFIRFILKAIWFGFIGCVICVIGTALFLAVLAVNSATTPNDFIVATILASAGLIGLQFLFIRLTRKPKKSLVRWTRKSFKGYIPLVVIAMILTVVPLSQLDEKTFQVSSPDGLVGSQGYVEGLSFKPETLLSLTNDERSIQKKPSLKINQLLSDSAKAKCDDMVKNDYWSHNGKDGKEPWVYIEATGYGYAKAGENLAYGFGSEADVVQGWMNSDGHRKNLLDGEFSEVGFGMCVSDNYVGQGKQLIVVQHFGSPGSVQNQSTGGNNTTQNTGQYQQPQESTSCAEYTIYMDYQYKDDPNMFNYETREIEGKNGKERVCYSSNGTRTSEVIEPMKPNITYQGTKTPPNPYEPINQNQQTPNYSQCNQFAGTSAYQACIDAINAQQ